MEVKLKQMKISTKLPVFPKKKKRLQWGKGQVEECDYFPGPLYLKLAQVLRERGSLFLKSTRERCYKFRFYFAGYFVWGGNTPTFQC